MSIQFVAKVATCLALAAALSLRSAGQQTTAPASSDSSEQTPPQDETHTPTSVQQTPAPLTSAQQPASQPPASSRPDDKTANQTPDQDKNAPNAGGKVEGTSNDRLFYTLPNFLTLEKGQQLPPLSSKDKFKVVALGTFDYIQYPWWGVLAAINQAENSEPGYGQGWLGYAKRYGATAGDSTIENFMVGAVYPSLFRQDPRFYYLPTGGATRRTLYAVSRIFVTRSDSGKAQFNFSEILGSATAAAISTYSYHPKSTYMSTPTNPHLFIPSDRTLTNTASVWGTQVALDTITLVVKEFWPDVHKKMAKKKNGDAITPAPKP